MVRDPRPRFAQGHGEPPRYLAQVRSAAGEVRFAGGGVPDRSYACADEAALASLLGRLDHGLLLGDGQARSGGVDAAGVVAWGR